MAETFIDTYKPSEKVVAPEKDEVDPKIEQ